MAPPTSPSETHPLLPARSEWGVNQHRDSLALYVGFDSLTQYIAVAENESVGRVKFNCLQVSASNPQVCCAPLY